MPSERFLLRNRHAVEALNPASNPAHFHHLAEVERRRQEIGSWLSARKRELGVPEAQPVIITDLRRRNPRVEQLFRERDERQIKAILSLARIAPEKHARVVALTHEIQQRAPALIESDSFIRPLFSGLGKAISPRERKRLETAFDDWFHARTFFERAGQELR